jgi:uncharacterized ferritin-like protein (DUF455 family)
MHGLYHHAKHRFAERYGVRLTPGLHQQIVQQIQNNESMFLTRSSNSRSIHLIRIANKWYKVVYSRKHQTLVTTFP